MRIRICYAKQGSLVYTSTLDVQKLWERSIRRARLTLQYSQGFHPQPRIQIANPLPLGFTGLHELVDIWLEDEDITQDQIISNLYKSLPIGIRLNSIEEIPENSASLPKQVLYSEYIVYPIDQQGSFDELSQKCVKLLEKDTIVRTRNKKTYDLRPLILELSVIQTEDGAAAISMRLPTNPNETGRPEEVMVELGFNIEEFKVFRDRMVLKEQIA